MVIAVIALLVSLWRPDVQGTISADFVEADRVFALKEIARQSGHNIYVGPTVGGKVTVSLRNASLTEALKAATADTELEPKIISHDLVEPTIIVAAAESCEPVCDFGAPPPPLPEDAERKAFLLRHAPPASVVQFLQGQFPAARFQPHQTENGFYATAGPKELEQMEKELLALDIPQEPPPPPRQVSLPVHEADLQEVLELLKTLVPDAEYEADFENRALLVTATPGALDHVREMLSHLDQNQTNFLEAKLVVMSPEASAELKLERAPEPQRADLFEPITPMVRARSMTPNQAYEIFHALELLQGEGKLRELQERRGSEEVNFEAFRATVRVTNDELTFVLGQTQFQPIRYNANGGYASLYLGPLTGMGGDLSEATKASSLDEVWLLTHYFREE